MEFGCHIHKSSRGALGVRAVGRDGLSAKARYRIQNAAPSPPKLRFKGGPSSSALHNAANNPFPGHRCTTQCCRGHICGSKAGICPALTWRGQAEFPPGCAHAASARPECTRHSAGSPPPPPAIRNTCSRQIASHINHTCVSSAPAGNLRESLRAIRQARRRRRQSQLRLGQTQTPPPAKLRTASVLLAHPRKGKPLSLGA